MTPSVTTVLGVFADFSHVPSDGRLAEAADRGSRLHRWSAAYCRNPAMGTRFAASDIQLMAQSFALWHKFMVKETHAIELWQTHPTWGYTGTLDFIFTLNSSELVLIDLKTPVTKSRLWQGQLAAYNELCRVNHFDIKRAGVLQPDRTGNIARVHWYEDQARDLNAFLAALTAYKYFKGEK